MTIFEENEGVYSMRRVLAFILALLGIGIMVLAVLKNCSWQTVLVAGSVPILSAIILLFFTTWNDIRNIVSAIRK